MSLQENKPPIQPRASLTRKPEGEEPEGDSKPTLGHRATKMVSRQERIVQALGRLDDNRLQLLTTRIGPDELAVALLDADATLKNRLAACLSPDALETFNHYLTMGREKLPSSVVDEVQGKLLRLCGP